MAASSHDDSAGIELYHHSVYSDAYAGDAIFRALARPVSTRPGRTPSWDAALALSHGRREVPKRRRISDLLTTQDRIAREYLVTRRLSTDIIVGRNWAQTWARENIRIGAAAPAQKQIFCALCDGVQQA